MSPPKSPKEPSGGRSPQTQCCLQKSLASSLLLSGSVTALGASVLGDAAHGPAAVPTPIFLNPTGRGDGEAEARAHRLQAGSWAVSEMLLAGSLGEISENPILEMNAEPETFPPCKSMSCRSFLAEEASSCLQGSSRSCLDSFAVCTMRGQGHPRAPVSAPSAPGGARDVLAVGFLHTGFLWVQAGFRSAAGETPTSLSVPFPALPSVSSSASPPLRDITSLTFAAQCRALQTFGTFQNKMSTGKIDLLCHLRLGQQQCAAVVALQGAACVPPLQGSDGERGGEAATHIHTEALGPETQDSGG